MSNVITRYLIVVLLLCVPAEGGPSPSLRELRAGHAQAIQVPAAPLRFAVIGDFGSGTREQFEVAKTMAAVHVRSGYDMVITAGDNLYGGFNARAIVERFETPYRPLLNAGVSFFASLGNHDPLEERLYAPFNMGGQRFYTFTRLNVQFFALDSNYMDTAQLTWLRRMLEASTAPWKIAFFHHPLYSSAGAHGAELDLRAVLEPLFVQYGVQVVFSGHDHVYERFKPQRGITYFVCGSSGKLRRGDLGARSPQTAAGFDQDLAFMVVEIKDDVMRFQAISRTDAIVDSGALHRVAPR
jgi:3',5'-cyclic AMP phosphodiesterase CpdA